MFSELIWKRRSYRKFADKAVEKEKIDALVDAALLAPSSRSLAPCRFVVVTEKSLMEQLSEVKPHGASFLRNAPLGLAVCADPRVSDVWVEDASIAAIYLHLAADAMGLGSCWVQVRKRMCSDTVSAEEKVSEILQLDANLKVEAIIGIGYPGEAKTPRTRESLDLTKVSYNSCGL